VIIGQEGSLDWRADAPVMPDRGGEGEQPGGDAGIGAGQRAAAMAFEGGAGP